MADFIKTIANSTNFLGGSQSSKWGQANYPYTMTWGVTKWGEGTFSLIFSVDKYVTNSLLPDTAILKSSEKMIVNTFTANGDLSSEILASGIWRIVFVSDTVNVEDRDMASWTTATDGTATFTCLPAGSTSWT